MASGLGPNLQTGKCFFHFQDFAICMKSVERPAECAPLRNDYFECLHGHREGVRQRALKAEEQAHADGKGSHGAAGGGGGGHH